MHALTSEVSKVGRSESIERQICFDFIPWVLLMINNIDGLMQP